MGFLCIFLIGSKEGGPCVYGSPAEEAVVKAAYFSSRDRIKSIVADVEGLQVELLATVSVLTYVTMF